jgi:hypothetical protein
MGPAGPQGPEGPAGTDTLGSLACAAGDSVSYNGTAWVCDDEGTSATTNASFLLTAGQANPDPSWSTFSGGGFRLKIVQTHDHVLVTTYYTEWDHLILEGNVPAVREENLSISANQFRTSLSDKARTISPIKIQYPAIQINTGVGETEISFIPGQPMYEKITFGIEGTDIAILDWVRGVHEGNPVRKEIAIDVGPAREVRYLLQECLPSSYQPIPNTVPAISSLEVFCTRVELSAHQSRPYLADWLLALQTGSDTMHRDLQISDMKGSIPPTRDYLSSFITAYTLTGLDKGSSAPIRETVEVVPDTSNILIPD